MTWRLLFALPLLLLTACNGSNDRPAPPDEALPLTHWFPMRVGEVELNVQLAVRLEEMRRGLMFREQLAPTEGMIFVYDQPKRMTFWMPNVSLPLDVGFFTADGQLQQILKLYPNDPTQRASRDDNLHYALEVNRGWFAQHGLTPGAQLDLALLAEALRQRGFDPKRYIPQD